MTCHQNDILIIQKVCTLYAASNFSTLENISKNVELQKYELSSKKLTDILHSAIKYNLIDDATANFIKDKVIRHSERKGSSTNYKLRESYEKLFEERKQDKKAFPHGHSIIDLKISSKCNSTDTKTTNYQQTSLLD